MSDNVPPGIPGPSAPPPGYTPAGYTPPTTSGYGQPPAPGFGQPVTEHLQSGAGAPLTTPPKSRNKRRGLIIGGAALTGLLVGGGVWGWMTFFQQGPQPAEALPDSTLGYVALDLDPSGQQKVEAIQTLRKFPAFRDEIGLDTDDDVRKKIFDAMQDDGVCDGLDFEKDIDSWMGQRIAVAAVDRGDETPAPVVVLQIKDQDAAEKGLEKLVACGNEEAGESEDFGGYAFNGDWVILAETEDIAKDVVADAKERPLSDDADYEKWTDAVGDPGVLNLYAAPEAGAALLDVLEEYPFLFGGGYDYGCASSVEPPPGYLEEEGFSYEDEDDYDFECGEPELEPADQIPAELRKSFEEFKGGAGTVRFDDGNLEIEFATGNIPGSGTEYLANDRGTDVLSTLPDTTAAALGAGFKEGWAQAFVDQLTPLIEQDSGMSADDAIAEFEAETGLSVPEDVEALGGESFAISFDSDFDASAFDDEDITRVPVGAKIKGDPEAIEAALDKIRLQMGPDGDLLLSRTEGDYVLISGSEDYLDKLAESGDLGDSEMFQELVPDGGDASSVFFVNFDAGDGWLDDLAGNFLGEEEVENLSPLRALGISSWVEGDDQHVLLKITTD